MRLVVQIIFFVPILIGYWYAHSKLSLWVQWVPDLFSDRPLRLAGLLFGAILCGAIAGLIFAAPVRLIYQKQAVLAAAIASLGAAAFDAYHMQLAGRLPFTKVALLLDLTVFLLALPLCVLLLRWLRPNKSFKPTPLRGAA